MSPPFGLIESLQTKGTARPSIASKYLQDLYDTNSFSEEKMKTLKEVLGVLYVTGIDTVSVQLFWHLYDVLTKSCLS